MNEREKDLLKIKSFIEETDKELTLILQSVQWDRQHLLQGKSLVQCKYDPGHRIPLEIQKEHEEQCFYKKEGYAEEDLLLPDPFDASAKTLVKLNSAETRKILCAATIANKFLERGDGCKGEQPMTLERLQATYTADERCVIHDAVVAAAPACHDLSDLTLLSEEDKSGQKVQKTRLEILAELRDMKRRRVKYRVASKTRNYSDVLRDVIRSQMELYTGVKDCPINNMPNLAQGENSKKPTDVRIEDPHDLRKLDVIITGKGEINERNNQNKECANNDYDQRKYNERHRNENTFRDEYRYRDDGRKKIDLRDSGHLSEGRGHDATRKYRQDNERLPYTRFNNDRNSSADGDTRYNTSEYYHQKETRYDREIRDRDKSYRYPEKRKSTREDYRDKRERSYEEKNASDDLSPERERIKYNKKEDYRHERDRAYDEKSKDYRKSYGEGDRRKRYTSDKYRDDKDRRYERKSRDRRKEDRYDKNKNYESRDYHDVKDREEKRKRRDSSGDHSQDEKRKRQTCSDAK